MQYMFTYARMDNGMQLMKQYGQHLCLKSHFGFLTWAAIGRFSRGSQGGNPRAAAWKAPSSCMAPSAITMQFSTVGQDGTGWMIIGR